MRIERWYWLPLFCLVSLCLHLGMVYNSRHFTLPEPPPKATEMEVTLEPPTERAPEPKKPESAPRRRPAEKPSPTPPVKLAALPRPAPSLTPAPKRIVHATEPRRTASNANALKPNVGGIADRLRNETPTETGLPVSRSRRIEFTMRNAPRTPIFSGGGSPATGLAPGRGGASGAEIPPDDVMFHYGGAGGTRLPAAAPRSGGGGGRSILSVENPLAKEQAPAEAPGIGSGRLGGAGAGRGGGAGFGTGRGIGLRPDGRDALASLHRKAGAGIGAAQGSGLGTHAPGGGRGTGAELPGIGGEGVGYNRGRGVGMGRGEGVGPGAGELPGSGNGASRGIPFGDITGILDGDAKGGGGRNGGPGGSGRGAVFGGRLPGGGGGRIHVLYLLDSSGSMREHDKIGKARAALKKALSELKPTDTFNVLNFDHSIHQFAPAMLPGNPENIQNALSYVDGIQLHNDTNLSGALEAAFSQPQTINQIYILSDGEPHTGIEDFGSLRELALRLNRQKARISTLALGLGEHFKGMDLLKSIADDNGGVFNALNLSAAPQKQ